MSRPVSILVWGAISVLGAAAFGVLALARGETINAAWLLVAAVCTYAALPTFWTLPTAFLTGTAAAGGIALVSSLGNLGPAVMPTITTWINTTSGTPVNSMYLVIALYVVAGAILGYVMRPVAAGPRLAPA